MFVVFLRFSANQGSAQQHMAGHQAWIRQGFEDGVFLLTGSLQDRQGGVVLAHGSTREALEARVRLDPFVAEDVVRADIVELAPSRADARLQFLMNADRQAA